MEGSIASKWLELLTGIAPGVKRAMMLLNPDTAPFIKSYVQPSFEAAARSLKVALIAAPVHNDTEIEATIAELGREPGSGLLGMPDNFIEIHPRDNHIAGSAEQYSCGLPDTRYRQRRWSAFLRGGFPGYISSSRPLC